MKILIIRNFPSYMSIKKNTYNIQEVGLARAFVRKGHICDILLWTDKEEELIELPVDGTEKTVRIFYKRGKTFLKNTVYPDLDNMIEQYDVIQPCEYNQIQSWMLARKYPKKTTIFHGSYFSTFNKRYNIMCAVFDLFFTNSYVKNDTVFLAKSVMAKKFLASKGIPEKNIYVCGVGIDTQALSSSEQHCEEPLCLEMKKAGTARKLLYVGRFEERRNIPFILDVLKLLKEKDKAFTLFMIGTGDKKYLDQIWAYADSLGVKDSIVWQEKMEQKYLSEIYRMADCFLLPTNYEIFGMVLLEAMYYETAVITTYNGGSSTLIKDNANGMIIDNFDKAAWADRILALFTDENQLRHMQKAAHKTIADGFLWDSLSSGFEKAYLRADQ